MRDLFSKPIIILLKAINTMLFLNLPSFVLLLVPTTRTTAFLAINILAVKSAIIPSKYHIIIRICCIRFPSAFAFAQFVGSSLLFSGLQLLRLFWCDFASNMNTRKSKKVHSGIAKLCAVMWLLESHPIQR